MPPPLWVKDAVFYQIFPDRFRNGDLTNDPPVVLPWNKCAVPRGFHGGDLAGITQGLDYLVELGVNALYLNPIFLSPSNHRYNTVDYYTIDPKLGKLDDFHHMLDEAHRRNMRVILDGVFNHCGRGFFAFSDVLENGADSPYTDWFTIKRFPVDAYGPGDAKDYLGWWNFKSLPKLNTANPRVRTYIMRIARYWIEQGADGWRLDVPNEIDDDDFWAEFRHVVKSANPEAYLVGEIWDAQPRWVGEGHFDGLMNYPLRTAVLGLLNEQISPTRYAVAIDQLLHTYAWENTLAMLVLLGSHDVERVLTMLGGDIQKAKLAAFIQFAYPGAPSIYYGDEIGLSGGKDPACRGGFPWDQRYWNQDLQGWYRKLTTLRREHAALRSGDYRTLLADDAASVYAFSRRDSQETLVGVINCAKDTRSATLPFPSIEWANIPAVKDLISGQVISLQQGSGIALSLPPNSALLLAHPA